MDEENEKVEGQIYRQKSLDQMLEPEQYSTYIKVNRKRGWLFIVAAVLFVAGLISYILLV